MWRIVLLLLVATNSLAELPPTPEFIGDIKRDEQDTLIVTSKPPLIKAEHSPTQSSPPATVDSPKRSKSPPPPISAQPPVVSASTQPSQHYIDNTPPVCAREAITCIEVISTGDKTQASVPITFGQPFKAADLARGMRLSANDNQGSLPLQMDEESSHADGSTRFAVISARLSKLKPGEKRVVNLYRDTAKHPAAKPAAIPNSASLDLRLLATVYSPQVSQLTFGNRSGTTPGIPFEAGEQITLQLGETIIEQFTLTVTPALAGGHFPSLTKIAEGFRDLINRQSQTFHAYKLGEGGGFEKLWITTRAPNTPAFSIKAAYTGKARISILNQQEFRPPTQYEALPHAELDRMIRCGAKPRLLGPVAREYTIVTPFLEQGSGKKHPQLTARLHTRFLENNQRIRSDLVLENNWAYEPEPGNILYDLTVTQGTRTLLRQKALTHYHHARWHKVLWTKGEAPQARVRHNMPYFLASKATWNYNLALKIPESVLAEEKANLLKQNTGPMSSVFITPYFPTTGGRQDIGPLPRWTALYLVSQDERAEASMFANADAAAGIPIHYRDLPTDQPVSLDNRPGLALAFGQSSPKDNPPSIINRETPWSPDTSHQASFAFIPYLISGDSFYLDEILFWSAWNLFSIDPNYREREKGLIHAGQMRAQAWVLRSISESAYALPNRHPDHKYYKKKLSDNLEWYVNHYPKNPATGKVSPLGAMEQSDKFGQTAPWQNDFMALVVGLVAQRGEPVAKEYFNWLSRFTVNRFANETDGFCRFRSPGYWIRMRDKSGMPYQSWQDVYKANWPSDPPCETPKPLDGAPEAAGGYPAVALAMLAISTDVGADEAETGYKWLKGKIPAALNAMQRDPTWAIVPATSHKATATDLPLPAQK